MKLQKYEAENAKTIELLKKNPSQPYDLLNVWNSTSKLERGKVTYHHTLVELIKHRSSYSQMRVKIFTIFPIDNYKIHGFLQLSENDLVVETGQEDMLFIQ